MNMDMFRYQYQEFYYDRKYLEDDYERVPKIEKPSQVVPATKKRPLGRQREQESDPARLAKAKVNKKGW